MLLDALRSLQNKWMRWFFSAIGAAVLICTSFVYSDIAEENRAITFNKVYPPSRASSDLTAEWMKITRFLAIIDLLLLKV